MRTYHLGVGNFAALAIDEKRKAFFRFHGEVNDFMYAVECGFYTGEKPGPGKRVFLTPNTKRVEETLDGKLLAVDIKEFVPFKTGKEGTQHPRLTIQHTPPENAVQDIAIIIVQDAQGKLYVHRRRDDKKTYPGFYGLGGGGKVNRGETIPEGAARELKEELQIRSTPESLFDFPFTDDNRWMNVFRVRYDREIPLYEAEFQSAEWMTREQVDQLAAENKLMPDTKIAYEKFKNRFSLPQQESPARR